MDKKRWVFGLLGKYIICFCFFLGIEIKGFVLEFFNEVILGIMIEKFLVRMLFLFIGKNKSKIKYRENGFKRSCRKEFISKEDVRSYFFFKKIERIIVFFRKLIV